LVDRLAGGRPVVLVVDDLQRAGASTAAWLAFAGRRRGRHVVVTSIRSGTRPAAGVALVPTAAVHLGPLDAEATARLTGELAGGRLGPDQAASLHGRSGGNPLLLQALIRDGPSVDATTASVDTIAAAVDRRLADLDPAVTATLRAA